MENKVAIITGAASGIGLALAKACLQDGMNIIMADFNEALLNQEVTLLRHQFPSKIEAIPCDVRDEQAVQYLSTQTLKLFNRVDLLINNAGISGLLKPVWELTTNEIKQVFDVNLFGVFHCIQAFLPVMMKQTHRSHIVNMASFYSLCSGSQMAPYTMSKHALLALTESLYFDLKHQQAPIDVSVVCPSIANTPLLTHSVSNDECHIQRKLQQFIEHGRCVDDLAKDILYEIKNKTFYILPDKEIKSDCDERIKAIIEQTPPHEHALERVFSRLINSSRKS